jgi:hypothetical protein
MTGRRAIEVGVAALYLGLTLTLSYAVWGPYEGVQHDPAWAADDRLWPALVILHVAVGAAIGRWWALALPVAWALLSAPAGGYDTPVWIGIAFNLPFYWLPAIALGIAARKIAEHLLRAQGRLGSTSCPSAPRSSSSCCLRSSAA